MSELETAKRIDRLEFLTETIAKTISRYGTALPGPGDGPSGEDTIMERLDALSDTESRLDNIDTAIDEILKRLQFIENVLKVKETR